MHIIGDDGDREVLCEHGVGHGWNVHTCDGCCGKPGFLDSLGPLDVGNEGTVDHPDVTTPESP